MNSDFIQLPLIGGHKDFPQTDAETLINFFTEKVGETAVLRGMPGYEIFATASGSVGIRGIRVVSYQGSDRLFVVRGNKFLEWSGTAFVSRGTLSSLNGPLAITDNGWQVLVVDDVTGYGWDIQTGLTNPSAAWVENCFVDQANDPSGHIFTTPATAQASYCAGRCFTTLINTGRFYNCDLVYIDPDDATKIVTPLVTGIFNWPALNFNDAETFSDPVLAIPALGQVMAALGSNSSEWWQDQGVPNTALLRAAPASNIGISAPASACTHGDYVYWLGGGQGQGQVFCSSGGSPRRISDNQIEGIIASIPLIEDCVGMIFQERGHVFYQLSFMFGKKTLVYEIQPQVSPYMAPAQGLWAVRESRDPSTYIRSQFYGICVAIYNGMNLIGDYRNGNIYIQSMSSFTDNGDVIYRERTFPPYPQESDTLTFHKAFELFMDVGNAAINGRSNSVMLDWTDDGGRTWSLEQTRDLGSVGQYGLRLVWNGLGSAFRRNYRIKFTADREIIVRAAGVRI